MTKVEAMFLLVEPISKEDSLYTNSFDRKDPALDRRDSAGIDKAAKMAGRSEDIKMPDVGHIPFESMYTTSSRLRSRIQSI